MNGIEELDRFYQQVRPVKLNELLLFEILRQLITLNNSQKQEKKQ